MEIVSKEYFTFPCPCGFGEPHMIPETTRDPVVLAVRMGRVDLLKTLLENGETLRKEVKICTYGNTTLSHIAPTTSMLRELIGLGIYVNAVDTMGRTPLHRAVQCSRPVDFVRELLIHGVDVNKVDLKFTSALHYEVSKTGPNFEIINLLLDYGATRDLVTFSLCFYSGSPNLYLWNKFVPKYVLRDGFLRGKYATEHLEYCFLDQDTIDYVHKCERELMFMKSHAIRGKLTLYELISSKRIISIRQDEGANLLRMLETENKYSEYKHLIQHKVNKGIERDRLLSSLIGTELTVSFSTGTSGRTRIIDLNVDVLYCIAEYLGNHDLHSLMIAFNSPA